MQFVEMCIKITEKKKIIRKPDGRNCADYSGSAKTKPSSIKKSLWEANQDSWMKHHWHRSNHPDMLTSRIQQDLEEGLYLFLATGSLPRFLIQQNKFISECSWKHNKAELLSNQLFFLARKKAMQMFSLIEKNIFYYMAWRFLPQDYFKKWFNF